MPDNGLGVFVASGSPSADFTFSATDDNTFSNSYFPLDNHALTNGHVKVNYTGRAVKATGTIGFASGSESAQATVNYVYDGNIYIVGDINGLAWGTSDGHIVGVQMDKNDDGTYEKTVTANANNNGECWLYFTKTLDVATYDDLGKNNFGPIAGWSYSDATNGLFGDLETANQINTIQLTPGSEYTITIDPANNKFKITKEKGQVTYEKVTSTDDVTDGNYLIVYETGGLAFDGNLETLDVSGNTKEITIVDNQIKTSDAIWFTYDAEANTLKSASGYYIGKTADSNGLDAKTTPLTNTISIDNEENADIIGSGGAHLRYNKSSGDVRFRYYKSSTYSGQQAIQLYKEVNSNKVATPKFTPAGGTYTEVQNVEILCATDGATIYYTTDGTDPTTASAVYNAAIPVNETKTIKAMAVKSGMENSAIATAEYIINLPITVSTLAAANALEDDTEFTFTENDVVVTFKQSYTTNNGNTTHTLIGLRDKSENDKTDGTGKGGSVFFDISSNIANSLSQGTVLNPDWKAKVDIYNGWVELVGASNVNTQDETVTVEPFDRTGVTLTKDNQSEYIKLNNVTISGTTATAGGSKATYTLFDRFKLEYEDGNYEYLIGVVNYYKTNTTENVTIYPLELKKVEKVATPTFDPGTGEYTTIQNVTIATTTEGAAISYKIGENGEWKTYENPIEVAESCTIYAKATKTGMDDSDEANATYTINLPTLAAPTFSPEAGTYDEAQTVTISAAEGAAISYKIGEEGEWRTYTEAIPVSENCTIYAKATKKGYIDSPEASAEYKFRQEATLSFGNETAFTVYPEEDFEAPTLTKTPADLAPIVYSIEGNENEIVLFDEDDGTVVIGDKMGTVTITAAFEGNDDYMPASASYTITVEPRPYVTAVPASLDFVTVIGKEPVSKTFTVMAENLKEGITLTLSETEVFSIDPTTITMDDAQAENGKTVTVTYTPTAATGEDFDEAIITIKSKDAEDVTVTLTGMATLPDPVLTVSTETLEMGTKPSDTFTVTGQNLTENVTVSIKEGSDPGFSVDPTSITPTEGAVNAATVTVTYSGTSTIDAYATVVVKSGTASKEVIVSAHVLPTPVILIDDETLDLGTSGEGTFDLMATDLRGNITLTCDNENFTVSPTTITPDENGEVDQEVTVTYTGNNTEVETAHITIKTDGAEDVVITVTAKAETYVDIAKPTFSPAAGTYTEPKQVAIACATPGVTIMYSINGGTPQAYTKPFMVSESCTVTATASKGSKVAYTDSEASAAYTINAAAAAAIADDYYYMQNNELSSQYANVAGRRTLNFVADPDQKAGTVFRVETGNDGAVKTLRSQAVDLQGYAKRAMAYVGPVVQMVVNKLNDMSGVDDATGTGTILGNEGLEKILAKFNECFDYNLYVEQADGGYRIFARTPSMQNVVDFYNDPANNSQIKEKLPMLEDYINQVLDKIRAKVVSAGMNGEVIEEFSLEKVWEQMGGTLIKPVKGDNAAIMAFYDQVLTNKEYVWDFAYQTAMIYLNNIKQTETYGSMVPAEYQAYIEKMQRIRPETKYYMIQYGNEPDYVSENNVKIIGNDPSTLWTLTKRENFTVNVPEANELNGSYYTTLYTDFGYELPEGVEAYAVTGIDANDVAQLTEITGTIPAQTPVLLKATAAGDKKLTLKMDSRGGAVEGNLLEGPDYLVKTYGITSPTVEAIFNLAAGFVPADMLAEYEYLKLRTSGTVNNKYFWNVNDALDSCTYKDANNEDDCVVRSLAVKNGTLAFSEHWTTENNKAFLVSDTKPVIYLEKETLAAPTFSPVPGSYTVDNGENVTITITAEDDATIYYKIGDGEYQPYEGPITASDDMTIVAKAVKDGMIASNEVTAVYVIDNPTVLPDVPAMKGYYQIKNLGNSKYANVAGRKTLNFKSEDEAKTEAGTVIWLETNGNGQVQSIRSQAADLQRYADRAMSYVPDIVNIVVNKINEMNGIEDATGAGSVLGENGLGLIMTEFNKCFDHHLYVEPADGGYRLYGKTPNMQHVVDFYRAHTAQVEAKLLKLEDFINNALTILENKIGSNVFTDFSLHQIWENMGSTLTEPTDDASKMAFYREVLNNKNYVWDFAYQTAMIYLDNIKYTQTYQNLVNEHPEILQYIDKIDQIRPDFKYYVVQKNDKPDFISEGNVDIINNAARTIWTLEERTTFNVNIDENNLFGCPLAGGVGGYATTLYTDFAYELPDNVDDVDVTAYKVTSIEGGKATIEALSGIIPAQTPVLLTAKVAGTVTLKLTTEPATADTTGNLLRGPDYLINVYDLKTDQVQSLFDQIKQKLGQDFYDTYVAQYEYLADLNSGTVNNKYFWGLKESDVEKCSNDGGENCVVRNLSGDKFIDNWKVETNKAFLVTDEYAEITFNTLHGDVNHDGLVNIEDVTDLIDRLLGMPDAYHLKACEYCSDVNKNGTVKIDDVTTLIDILLGIDGSNQATDPQGGE